MLSCMYTCKPAGAWPCANAAPYIRHFMSTEGAQAGERVARCVLLGVHTHKWMYMLQNLMKHTQTHSMDVRHAVDATRIVVHAHVAL